MTGADPADNWLTRRLAAMLRSAPVSNDPDGVAESLRRRGLLPEGAEARDDPHALSAHDPERMLFVGRTWRDLTRQLAACQAARRGRLKPPE